MRRDQFEKRGGPFGMREAFTREEMIAMVQAVHRAKLESIERERDKPLTDVMKKKLK